MKFLLTFTWKSDAKAQAEAIARFRKAGGQHPKGVRLLGRWTRMDFHGGFDLLESDDPKALTEFALLWSDVMELTLVPVVEDEELTEALKRAGR
jgi:hypothetical protein